MIKFRLSEAEAEVLEQKFQNSGFRSKSEFIRMMIFTGQIIRIDGANFKQLQNSIYSVSNNINQVAVRVNSTGSLYAEDIADLRNGVDEIRQQLKSFLSLLQRAKPSPTSQAPKRPKTGG